MNMQRFMSLATCAALGFVALPLHAATITVNSTDWENPSVVNGNCTLGEALRAALLDVAVDACAAGSGADTVELQGGATYTVTQTSEPFPLQVGPNTTLAGNGATIERSTADGTPEFSLVDIVFDAVVTLQDVTLRNGKIGSGGNGGCLRNNGTLTLKNVTFENCTAQLLGGAVVNNGATRTITVQDSRFISNTATGGTNGGGAIHNKGTLQILRTTFRGNKAIRGGAIANQGMLGVSDSTFDDNFAKLDGAAIYTVVVTGSAGNTTLSNSTLTNHTAPFGATITNDTNGQTTIVNSTIAGNQAPALKQVSGTLSVQNSLLASNTGGPCKEGSITSSGNNLIDAAPQNCLISAQESDLVVGEVTTVGLGTFTDSGTAGRGYFPLLSGSQAINAGNSAVCIDDSANNKPDLDQDQIGHNRAGACDIGAIEATCGDGVVHANLTEACDDGNTTDGDGCSATCTVESGFACNGEPSACATTCGNGVVAGAEQCDGAALAGATCASVTPATPTGTLACKADCTLDTTQCTAAAGPEPEPKSEPEPSPTPAPEPSPVAEPTPAPAPAEGGGGCSLVVY